MGTTAEILFITRSSSCSGWRWRSKLKRSCRQGVDIVDTASVASCSALLHLPSDAAVRDRASSVDAAAPDRASEHAATRSGGRREDGSVCNHSQAVSASPTARAVRTSLRAHFKTATQGAWVGWSTPTIREYLLKFVGFARGSFVSTRVLKCALSAISSSMRLDTTASYPTYAGPSTVNIHGELHSAPRSTAKRVGSGQQLQANRSGYEGTRDNEGFLGLQYTEHRTV